MTTTPTRPRRRTKIIRPGTKLSDGRVVGAVQSFANGERYYFLVGDGTVSLLPADVVEALAATPPAKRRARR